MVGPAVVPTASSVAVGFTEALRGDRSAVGYGERGGSGMGDIAQGARRCRWGAPRASPTETARSLRSSHLATGSVTWRRSRLRAPSGMEGAAVRFREATVLGSVRACEGVRGCARAGALTDVLSRTSSSGAGPARLQMTRAGSTSASRARRSRRRRRHPPHRSKRPSRPGCRDPPQPLSRDPSGCRRLRSPELVALPRLGRLQPARHLSPSRSETARLDRRRRICGSCPIGDPQDIVRESRAEKVALVATEQPSTP